MYNDLKREVVERLLRPVILSESVRRNFPLGTLLIVFWLRNIGKMDVHALEKYMDNPYHCEILY